ncbi:hypothetical protein [Halodesulfovibrio marinisediminis]|uniref:hypothetical protein n=1 Tax=Halodesulfovibrio marinisediminis TaxID=458711 RepID=UPI00111539D7|nr:hypothetical protein [Halodesulfovibrio marinisediminis]
MRQKVANLGIQRFAGAVHSFRDFDIKLPLGSTVIPLASHSTGLCFDGLTATSDAAGVSLYEVDYGAATIAVIPDSEEAVQWERFLVSSVRSPEDILFREPDGVIYYDHKNKELVAVYHQYEANSGQHIVGRAIVSGDSCPLSEQRKFSCNTASTGKIEAIRFPCVQAETSQVAALKASTSVGSGLSAESDMSHNSANMIATAGIASANAHSRCQSQQRNGGVKEIVRLYSQLRTLNPKHRNATDTYIKAYSINNYGVKDAYIVWNDKKEGGVLLADGTVVVPPKYCSLYVDSFGYVVTDDHGVGILDFSGNTILPCKYTLFTLNVDGLLKVGQQVSGEAMRYGLYNLQKRIWVEPLNM